MICYKHKERTIKIQLKRCINGAIKPFLQKEDRLNLDRMIEMMNLINTARSIQMEVQRFRTQMMDDHVKMEKE